jgi:hypothetical protein
MKKKVALLALLGAVSFNAAALDFGVGIKGGVGLNMLTGDMTDNQSFSARGHVGAYFELGLTEHFAIQPEFYVGINNAVGYKASENGITIEGGYKWTTFDIDVMFKGRFSMLYFMLGPTIHIGVGDVEGTGVLSDDDGFSYSDTNLTQPLVGLALEVGAEIPAGPGVFIVGVKTQWNFTELFSDSLSPSMNLHEPIALQLGYGFKF